MRLLILHRIPYHKIDYHRGIDHEVHDVTYIGTAAALQTLPEGLRCQRLERPGAGPVSEEVIARCRQLARFDRVVSLSEYELIEAALVRAALGVEGPTVAQVERVRDKIKMKEAVAAAGLRAPRYHALAPLLAGPGPGLGWEGRAVLKPRDGASSENVFVFSSAATALAEARGGRLPIKGFDPARFEIEEFVAGPILHVDGLMQGGRPVILLASRYTNTCLDYARGLPLGSVQLAPDAALSAWAERCLRAVGIEAGSFHLEGIMTADGPVFLEVAARVGGADVVDSFELATGVHMPSAELRLVVDPASDLRSVLTIREPQERSGWFVFPGHHLDGDSCVIHGADAFRDDPRAARWNQLAPGQPLPRSITYQAREVPVAGLLRGRSTEDLEAFLTRMFATIAVVPARQPQVEAA